jgi:hypothetical protein
MNRLEQLHRAGVSIWLGSAARSAQQLFFELALDDVRRAADTLRPA